MSDLLEVIKGGGHETLYFYNGTVKLVYDDKLHAYYVVEGDEKFLVPGATTVCGVIDKPALLAWASNSCSAYIRSKFVVDGQINREAVDNYTDSITMLDTLLDAGRANYRSISGAAKDIGHLAHEWLENRNIALISGAEYATPMPENEKAVNAIMAGLDWQDRHNFRPLNAEKKVFSRRLCTAGTYDWRALIDTCGNPACCPFSGHDMVGLGDYKSSKALYDEYRIQTAFYKEAHEEEFPDEPLDLRVVLRIGKEDGEFEPLVLSDPEGFQADLAAFEGALSIYNWGKQMQLDKRFERERLKAIEMLNKPKRAPRKVKIKTAEIMDIPVVAA